MKVLYISLTVLVFDQISKLLVKGIRIPFLNLNFPGFQYGRPNRILGDFFSLTFIENPGMAWGMEFGGLFKLFLSFFAFFAGLGIVYYIYRIRNEQLSLRVALAFILGGAWGNLIDRLFYGILYGYAPVFFGNVVDFLHISLELSLFGYSFGTFPVFNVADLAVTTGVVIFIFSQLKPDMEKEKMTTELS